MTLTEHFIAWAMRRAPHEQGVVTFGGTFLFTRYEFLRPDEWPDSFWDKHRDKYPRRPNALPWWLPFNAFVHHWNPAEGFDGEAMHDHPRWSITICLKGSIVERTPWGRRVLLPGSIVFRSRKAIHGFAPVDPDSREAWTLFIVGRRKHRQNTYVVEAR